MINEYSKLVSIPELEILGRNRNSYINDARQVYWLMLCEKGYNYTEIAKISDRTHATILSGIKRIKSLIENKDKKACALYAKANSIEYARLK